MPYSCLEYLGQLPTVDVIAICARDAVDQAVFRAHGAAVTMHMPDVPDEIALIAFLLIGSLLFLRLLALFSVLLRIGRGAAKSLARRPPRPTLRTLVERHRGKHSAVATKPDEIGVEVAAPAGMPKV